MAGNGHTVHHRSKTKELGPVPTYRTIRTQQLAIRRHKEVPILPFDGF
jgi:hypothetical protein